MSLRRASADETRARIVAAARELLSTPGGIGAFRVDAVAERAGVSRMTIYNQFGAKTGLIEAVFDSLAVVRVGVARLVAALALDDVEATLAAFVATFAEVWQADRLVIRRLQGLAALDPEFAAVWEAREARRREGMREIARRAGAPDAEAATAALYAVVSPEGFEAMAGAGRAYADVAPAVLGLARAVLGLDGGPPVAFEAADAGAVRRARAAGRAPRR